MLIYILKRFYGVSKSNLYSERFLTYFVGSLNFSREITSLNFLERCNGCVYIYIYSYVADRLNFSFIDTFKELEEKGCGTRCSLMQRTPILYFHLRAKSSFRVNRMFIFPCYSHRVFSTGGTTLLIFRFPGNSLSFRIKGRWEKERKKELKR